MSADSFRLAFSCQATMVRIAQSYLELLGMYGIHAFLHYDDGGEIRFEVRVGEAFETHRCHILDVGGPDLMGLIERAFEARGIRLKESPKEFEAVLRTQRG